MSRLLALLLILTMIAIAPSSAAAAGRRRFAAANSSSLRAPTNYDRASTSAYRGGYEQYPKFIGGFHYHDLHNVGIPNGDIGLRGNGISMSPW